MFCPGENCYWYTHPKVVDGKIVRRKCYYEPGCWRGTVDSLLAPLKRRMKSTEAERRQA